jgi:hypothetical protein
MSKHESWRTRKYWESAGGLLIEEFKVVERGEKNSIRLIDGVIVLGEENSTHNSTYFDISGRDIICIQTKKNRLGMYVMGQAFFSRELLRSHNPKTIKSVIVCGKEDSVLQELCSKYEIEVVVYP